MDRLVKNLNILWIFIYCSIISTAFGLQIFEHEEPCPLCYLQRIAMLSISIGAFLNVWYGVKLYHYGMILISALFGSFVALRQICLHICPGFPKFGLPFLGMSLYTWSFITFACSILMTAILLILYRPTQSIETDNKGSLEKAAFLFLLFVASGNVISVLLECGLTACKG